MEQLKSGAGSESGEADGAPAEDAVRPRWRRMPKRVVVIAIAGVTLLALIVAGVFAWRAHVRQQEAEAAQQRERAQAAVAAEAAAEAEAAAQVERGKKAHAANDRIMAASPPAASLPPPPKPEVAPSPASPAAKPAVAPVVAPPSAGADNAVAANGPTPAAGRPEPESAAVTAPTATGDCTLSGGTPGAYGDALSRCLQEFNRLEGRKP